MKLPVRMSELADEHRKEVIRYLVAEGERTAAINFTEEVDAALARIAALPMSAPRWPARPSYRRLLLPTFAYGVVYEIKPDEILILAIAHDRRLPANVLRPGGGSLKR